MVVVVVIVIVMALLIHSCEVSQGNSSLKNYAANVDTKMRASNANGAHLFNDLETGNLSSASGLQTLQEHLSGLFQTATAQLSQVQGMSAPSQLSSAQTALVEVMTLRKQGIGEVADNIQGAADSKTSKTAVQNIATGMYMLSGSDVTYKTFVAPAIVRALNKAKIAVGGTNGVQINGTQILGDLGWLNTRFIGEKIGANLPASAVNVAEPGVVQGHILNNVSVDGTQLSQSTTNDVQASPAPTFTLNFTNGGQTDEYDVECIVQVIGLSDVGTKIVPITKPGQTYNCSVTLPNQPTASTFQVKAGIVKVPGETNVSDNYMTYTVDFN